MRCLHRTLDAARRFSPAGMTTMAIGRDAEGRIYIADGDQAQLFFPEDGLYAEHGSGRLYTREDLLARCETLALCIRKSTCIFSADPEGTGTEVICGKTASVYTLTYDLGIYKQTFRLAVDDGTGLCLRLENVCEFLGFSAENTLEFTCTQFVTEDVVLPGTEN